MTTLTATSDQLFLQICKSSFYNLPKKTTLKQKQQSYREDKCFDKAYWYAVETTVPSMLCPLSVIEATVGGKYCFPKHILPLVDAKLIWVRDFTNCFPHSKDLELDSYNSHGLVADYKVKPFVLYLQYFLGNKDPNATLELEAWL